VSRIGLVGEHVELGEEPDDVGDGVDESLG
jgi:hypothetical protein